MESAAGVLTGNGICVGPMQIQTQTQMQMHRRKQCRTKPIEQDQTGSTAEDGRSVRGAGLF